MCNLRNLAKGVHETGLSCPREGNCLACRFIEKRLMSCIDENDRDGVWHWTSHAYGEMRECDLSCPATRKMAQMVIHMYSNLSA